MAPLRNHPVSWPVLLGLLVAAAYLLLLPFIARTWRATGDEPHYLLAAHSLAVDHDLDLTNNYRQFDYLNFYFSRDITPQTRQNRAGQQILNHQLGLPALIAPAYAVAGRFGALTMQAVIGGALAALSFKLAAAVSGDEWAALVAALTVAFTPPLLMYPYLVYPELLAAFIVTLILYWAVTRVRPAPAPVIISLLGLMTLPWLNRRFVPLALLLAILLIWAWRKPAGSRPWYHPARFLTGAVWPLTGLILAGSLLLWFNSRLVAPPRADITAPVDAFMFWTRLGRGLVGWLLDQQRGLFIFAPVYLLALIGIPPLMRAARRSRGWWTLLPILLSLGVTMLAGGFWIPWELGPRFLVAALPPLAAPLALAWRTFARRKLWLGMALFLLAVSLTNSALIIRQPELPYKSSLPLAYAAKTGLPLTDVLPNLAGYTRLSPPNGLEWDIEAGQPAAFIQSGPLTTLPFGHYRLHWTLRAESNLPPHTELVRLSVKTLGGGPIFNRTITAADLPADGRLTFSFFNPNPDHWRTPMVLHAVSAGQSRLWAGDVLFTPDPIYGWLLPYLFLAMALAAAWFSGRNPGPAPQTVNLPVLSPGVGWGLAALLLILLPAWLIYQKNLDTRVYETDRLQHFVGQSVPDTAAADGLAWQVDPRLDPPQKALHGPFEFYDKGRYHITFRMKLIGDAPPNQNVAQLKVVGAGEPDSLFTQPLQANHFTGPDLYHDFVLVVNNPRRQALSFEVEYTGLTALSIDRVTIQRVNNSK